ERRRTHRVAVAIVKSERNQEMLISQLLRTGVMILQWPSYQQYPTTDEHHAAERRWEHDCRDVIAAARKRPERFEWNSDWMDDGQLLIGVVRQQEPADCRRQFE